MAPELVIPLISASVSSVAWAIAITTISISKQKTERIKHSQAIAFDLERLRLGMEAYKHDTASKDTGDLVDLTLALGRTLELADESDSEIAGTPGPPDSLLRISPFSRSNRGQHRLSSRPHR